MKLIQFVSSIETLPQKLTVTDHAAEAGDEDADGVIYDGSIECC